MAVRKTTSAAKRSAPPKKAAPKNAVAPKASAAKASAAKASTAKTSAAKTSAAKTAAKATPAKKRVTQAVAARPATKKAANAKAPKSAPARRTAKKTSTTTGSARATAKKAVTTTSPARATPKKTAAIAAEPQRLRVRGNERPWTDRELAGVRADLEADIVRLRREISVAEVDLAGLMRDVGDGAGDDPADAGTATFEREQEISLANNAREMCDQSRRALSRIAGGTYGACESCGNPIGKNRLQAFPRATLCLTCKSQQERR